MKLSDFSTQEEALSVADALIEQNTKDYGLTGEVLDHPHALLKRYDYVKGHGKKRTWGVTETNDLKQECNPKNQKCLVDMNQTAAFMLGDGAPQPGAMGSAKVESVPFTDLNTAVELFRSLPNQKTYFLKMYHCFHKSYYRIHAQI